MLGPVTDSELPVNRPNRQPAFKLGGSHSGSRVVDALGRVRSAPAEMWHVLMKLKVPTPSLPKRTRFIPSFGGERIAVAKDAACVNSQRQAMLAITSPSYTPPRVLVVLSRPQGMAPSTAIPNLASGSFGVPQLPRCPFADHRSLLQHPARHTPRPSAASPRRGPGLGLPGANDNRDRGSFLPPSPVNDRPQGRSPTMLVLADGDYRQERMVLPAGVVRPRWDRACHAPGPPGGDTRSGEDWVGLGWLDTLPPCLGLHAILPASAKYACSPNGKLPLTCRFIYGYQGPGWFVFPSRILQLSSRDKQSLCGLLPRNQPSRWLSHRRGKHPRVTKLGAQTRKSQPPIWRTRARGGSRRPSS